MKVIKFLLWCGLCCPLSCFAYSLHFSEQVKNNKQYVKNNTKQEEYCEGPQPMRGTVRYTSPKGIGYNHGYSTLEFFLTPYKICNRSWLPFIDLRGHVFDNGRFAANAGMGLRYISNKRVWGGNVYYDYRDTSKQHYNQIALGLESLGKLFDYRINGYLPVGWKQSHRYSSAFNSFQGHTMLIQSKYDFALGAVNAEVGAHVNSLKKVPLYFAAGPYYMSGKGATTWGGCLRASISFFKNYVRIEGNVAYDHFFKWTGQGQISISIPFGGKCKAKRSENQSCAQTTVISYRAMQPVERNEIIPVGKKNTISPAINPATGQPYYFVFVNNTSNSSGTYESPYPTLLQAQNNSSQGDIIYVFPGNGTTMGMDSGIFLKENQKFWGSGVNHLLATSQGQILIPAQSSSSPRITNTNVDTEGNAITLATHNSISGLTITSAIHDAIYGTNSQSLEVSSCTIENTTTFPIETIFPGDASVSITDVQFLNNSNGISLTFNGTSNVVCSNNIFEGQISPSEAPLVINANNNSVEIHVENNIFNNNKIGGLFFSPNNVINANIYFLNNRVTNSGSGARGALGSGVTISPTGVNNNCVLTVNGNTFSDNTFLSTSTNSIYFHNSGSIADRFENLEVTVSNNTMSNNGGASALILATPVSNNLTANVTGNTIANLDNNAISIEASSGITSTGNVTISNNMITDIGGTANGVVIPQRFSTLDLTMQNNQINRCEGTGIHSYSGGINSMVLNISGNTITDCLNNSANAASGIDIEKYINLGGSITNNTLSDNVGTAVFIGSDLASPSTCISLSGNNSSTDYTLQNPGDGTFYLTPCGVESVNTGTINMSGTIEIVQSCSNHTPCLSCSNSSHDSSDTDATK